MLDCVFVHFVFLFFVYLFVSLECHEERVERGGQLTHCSSCRHACIRYGSGFVRAHTPTHLCVCAWGCQQWGEGEKRGRLVASAKRLWRRESRCVTFRMYRGERAGDCMGFRGFTSWHVIVHEYACVFVPSYSRRKEQCLSPVAARLQAWAQT